MFGLGLVLGISNEADFEGGTGNIGKSDGTDETLVLLRVVILKANLKFDGLSELAGLDDTTELSDAIQNHSVSQF